jgi:hypothetical protein
MKNYSMAWPPSPGGEGLRMRLDERALTLTLSLRRGNSTQNLMN